MVALFCRWGRGREKWKYPKCATTQAYAPAHLTAVPHPAQPRRVLFLQPSEGSRSNLSLTRPPLRSKHVYGSLLIPSESQASAPPRSAFGSGLLALLPLSPVHTRLRAPDLPVALLTGPASGPCPLQSPPVLRADVPVVERPI